MKAVFNFKRTLNNFFRKFLAIEIVFLTLSTCVSAMNVTTPCDFTSELTKAFDTTFNNSSDIAKKIFCHDTKNATKLKSTNGSDWINVNIIKCECKNLTLLLKLSRFYFIERENLTKKDIVDAFTIFLRWLEREIHNKHSSADMKVLYERCIFYDFIVNYLVKSKLNSIDDAIPKIENFYPFIKLSNLFGQFKRIPREKFLTFISKILKYSIEKLSRNPLHMERLDKLDDFKINHKNSQFAYLCKKSELSEHSKCFHPKGQKYKHDSRYSNSKVSSNRRIVKKEENLVHKKLINDSKNKIQSQDFDIIDSKTNRYASSKKHIASQKIKFQSDNEPEKIVDLITIDKKKASIVTKEKFEEPLQPVRICKIQDVTNVNSIFLIEQSRAFTSWKEKKDYTYVSIDDFKCKISTQDNAKKFISLFVEFLKKCKNFDDAYGLKSLIVRYDLYVSLATSFLNLTVDEILMDQENMSLVLNEHGDIDFEKCKNFMILNLSNLVYKM